MRGKRGRPACKLLTSGAPAGLVTSIGAFGYGSVEVTTMTDLRSASTVVTTPVGPLRVKSMGAGPPAVSWHSLFVDSRSVRAR